MSKKVKDMMIFCDFDGTISKEDVLNLLFDQYGDEVVQQLEEDFKEGKIDDKETLTRKFERISLTEEEFERFVHEKVEIDPYFKDFYQQVKEKDIDFIIVSGGFINYIEILLEKENIELDFPLYGNKLEFEEDRVIPKFLHDIDQCHQPFGVCGSCKWEVLKEHKKDDKELIYIGDGLTDRCPGEEVDHLLAKKDKLLERYCLINEIPYTPFINFKDIPSILF